MQRSVRFLSISVVLFCVAAGAWAVSAAEHNNLGIAAYDRGDFKTAIEHFEAAYDGARDNATVRRNLCNAHQATANDLAQKKEFKNATKHLEMAISIDPENPSPLLQLGSYYLRLDQVQEAIYRLEEAIEIKPGLLDAHELLGEAYYRDNDLSSARAQWEYVIEMDPKRKGLVARYEKAFREESVEQDFNRSGSRHFKISYPKGIPYQLRSQALTVLERAYMEVGRKFGGVYPPPPVQVVLYDAEQFSQATQLNGHVGAVYDGKIRSPLTDADGQYLAEDELKRRLTHEYVHVVVRHVAGENVPWWINEGLAETFSRPVEGAERDLLQRAYAADATFPLTDLEAHQLRVLASEELRLAYAQSHASMDLLWTRYGKRRLVQLMSDLTAGVSAQDAIQRIYRRSYAALQEEVKHLYE